MLSLLTLLFGYWILLFFAGRAFFLGLNISLLSPSSQTWRTIVRCFYEGLQLDCSMSAYLLVIPWLVLSLDRGCFHRYTRRFLSFYVTFFTLIIFLIYLADSAIYPEWQTKLNARALISLQHPSEIIKMAHWQETSLMITLWLSLTAVFTTLYCKLAAHIYKRGKKIPFKLLPVFIILAAMAITYFARGGVGPIAIDISRVYFSKDAVINDGATNTVNYLLRSVMKSSRYGYNKNPYQSFSSAEAESTVRLLLHTENDANKRLNILTVDRPNIVFIVLESWTADMIPSLGGDLGITPEWSKLEKEGLLFTQLYANGDRSQQGLASIFMGIPALPNVTISEDPLKLRKLPKLVTLLMQQGYQENLFLYGGDLEFGNIKAVIMGSGFENIFEKKDIDSKLPRGMFGVHDSFMFNIYREKLLPLKSPFISVFYTMSNHRPYDIPTPGEFKREGRAADYIKSIMYTDRAIGEFFTQVRKEPWFEKSLFVLVSDHGYPTHRERPNWHPDFHKIPFLIVGPALKKEYHGKKWDEIGSQIDIPHTLLAQLGISAEKFTWSSNLLHQTRSRSTFYSVSGGGAMIFPEGALVFDAEHKKQVYTTLPGEMQSKAEQQLKSYLQVAFDQFLKL